VGQVNVSWGASDLAAPTAFGDFEAQLNIQDGSTTLLRVRDGGVAEPLETFATNTWYSTWLVINNLDNNYEVWMQGGALAVPTKLDDNDGPNIGNTLFGFRNGAATNDLVSAFLRTGGNHNSNFYVDDIYLDVTGQNLSNPAAIPEPSAVALIGCVVLVAGYFGKRRN
jgi:hypothetical protein